MIVNEIVCTSQRDFFEKWVEWLRARHGLSSMQMRTFAAILWRRQQLSKVMAESLLDEYATNQQGRREIYTLLGIKSQQLRNIMQDIVARRMMAPVRDADGKVAYYRINPMAIPDFDEDSDTMAKYAVVFRKSEDYGH